MLTYRKNLLLSLSTCGLAALLGAAPGRAQVVGNFNAQTNAPLLKKFNAYSTTIGSKADFRKRNDRDFSKVVPLESSTYRVDLAMGKGDCWAADLVGGSAQSRTYNWSELDYWTRKCNDNNVMPYISWSYIPTPFQANNNWRDLNEGIPNWRGLWGDMHADLAGHVKSTSALPVYHEIYNEPDLGEFFWNVLNIKDENIGFLQRDDFTQRYNDMYRAAAQGIRRADGDAIVGGPAFAVAEIYTGGFLDYVKNNSLPLDFFSMHQYRDSGKWPDRLNTVRQSLDSHGLNQTALQISEYNYAEGPWRDDSYDGHRFQGATRALVYMKEIIDSFQDVEKVHWAQFLNALPTTEFGIIDYNGTKKAIYNAFKIFGDMPVNRYALNGLDADLQGMASRSPDKCTIVLWNTGGADRTTAIRFDNVPFGTGDAKVYRIDRTHASARDGAPEELAVDQAFNNVSAGGYQWSGTVPAQGTVYLTLVRSGSGIRDFHPEDSYVKLGRYVKPHLYYYARSKSFWNNFDEKRWTAYVGSGNEGGGMVAPVGVEAEGLPATINFRGELSGTPQNQGVNSAVGVQIDFRAGGGFTKSVFFHGGTYNAGRNWGMPWGKGGTPTQVQQVNLADFNVKLADYAPGGWDGRVIITTIVQDCGANVRFSSQMRNGSGTPPPVVGRSPYAGVIQLPGVVEAENFDKGGEGVGYHDSEAANLGGEYRPGEGVDIQSCTEGGYNVGWTAAGEWLEYSVNVAAAGTYQVGARVASPNAGSLHYTLDGQSVLGSVALPNTGGYQRWQTVNTTVSLPAGAHVLRVSLDSGTPNLNQFTVAAAASAGLVSGQVYRLTARHSGQVLDLSQCAGEDGAKVQQYRWLDNACQRWRLEATDGGYYKVRSLSSGRVLEVNGAGVADGDRVQQWSDNGGDWQQWQPEAVAGGYYKLTNRHSGRVLEVGGISQEPEAGVQQWGYVAGGNQQWQLDPVGPAPAAARVALAATSARAAGDEAPTLQLAPNPATNQVQLSWTGLGSGPATLSVINVQGRLVQQQLVKEATQLLNTAGLSQGLYLVKVQVGNAILVKKLIIK